MDNLYSNDEKMLIKTIDRLREKIINLKETIADLTSERIYFLQVFEAFGLDPNNGQIELSEDTPAKEIHKLQQAVAIVQAERDKLLELILSLQEHRDSDLRTFIKVIESLDSPIAKESLKIFQNEFRSNIDLRKRISDSLKTLFH